MTARSPLYFAWRRFADNKAAVVSGLVLLIIMLMAIFAPLITKTGFADQDFLTQAYAFPSTEFWFGVDDLGRDFFTRIVYGARVSLTIGFAAAAFSVLIGIPLGAIFLSRASSLREPSFRNAGILAMRNSPLLHQWSLP